MSYISHGMKLIHIFSSNMNSTFKQQLKSSRAKWFKKHKALFLINLIWLLWKGHIAIY